MGLGNHSNDRVFAKEKIEESNQEVETERRTSQNERTELALAHEDSIHSEFANTKQSHKDQKEQAN